MENADEVIARAPLPTAKTLRARRNIFVQFLRFVSINFKMIKMIRKGHHPMEKTKKP
ncbi:MAG: hypothetical protein NTX12_00955 [Actinobacteria bacterium]|nr:hypothetical protein [Actinomycetota bacterium]